MASLTYHTAGESHGPALIILVQGMPAGVDVDLDLINTELRRRQGGYGRGGRQKIETDVVEILSGVRRGRTIGSPIAMRLANKDSRLDDIERTPPVYRPRPGHADLAGSVKWLTTDCRETLERASARETASRVAAGALTRCLLGAFGIDVLGFVRAILDVETGVEISDENIDAMRAARDASDVYCPDEQASEEMRARIRQAKVDKDTVGGLVEAHVFNVPIGLGSSMDWRDKLDARLAYAVMGIQAFKAVEIGLGKECARRPGSQVHDPIRFDRSRADRPSLGFVRDGNTRSTSGRTSARCRRRRSCWRTSRPSRSRGRCGRSSAATRWWRCARTTTRFSTSRGRCRSSRRSRRSPDPMSGAARDNPALIIHLHIPKNAGTTLGRMLRLRVARDPRNWARLGPALGLPHIKGAWTERAEALRALPERARRRVQLFDAHAAYGMHEALPGGEDARYVTLLREPIDRTLSTYSYLREKGRMDPATSIEDFASGPPVRQPLWTVDNAQVRFLAGERGEIIDAPPGGVTRTMLDVALERIASDRFLIAGLIERFDESVLLLARRLGWGRSTYMRSNVTRERLSRDELPAATIDFLRERNALDIELYERAGELLTERVRADAGFGAELERFRAANARNAARGGGLHALIPAASRMARRLGILR